jgi:hypothetical protein
VNFARSIGAAIGVAALGGLLFASMGTDANAVQSLLDPAARETLDPSRAAALRGTLASGLHAVYFAMVLVSVVGALLARRLPVAFREEGDVAASSAASLGAVAAPERR